MTEQKKDIPIHTSTETTKTVIVPFITVSERDTHQISQTRHTFKEATKEEISHFVDQQMSLDAEQKQALQNRLLKIQERLNKIPSKDEGSGI